MKTYSESDISLVMTQFEIDRGGAIDMLAKGVNPSVLRNGYPMLQTEISEITKRYGDAMQGLLSRLEKVTDQMKADLKSARKS